LPLNTSSELRIGDGVGAAGVSGASGIVTSAEPAGFQELARGCAGGRFFGLQVAVDDGRLDASGFEVGDDTPPHPSRHDHAAVGNHRY
jgi:hypothetical protein